MTANEQLLVNALQRIVDWYGKRNNKGDDALLPISKQEEEICSAMLLIDKFKEPT